MEIGLMKYLVLALTLIFSMSGSVNADDHNKWIMIWTDAWYGFESPVGEAHHMNHNAASYQNQSECHEVLKKTALDQNKTNPNFQNEGSFIIEVIDDIRFRATAKDGYSMTQIFCIEVKSSALR
jgi:hypothetical protein